MIKSILILFLAFLGFNNSLFAAACSTANSGTTTTWPASGGGQCSAEPDYYKLTIYDMKLCTSAPAAPTSSSAIVLTSCQNVFYNSSGNAIEVVNGSSSAMTGTISRPTNGTYTHGYIRISKDFVIGDSRQYSADATDGTTIGDYCATTSSGVQCSGSAITITSSDYRTMTLNDFGTSQYTYNTTENSEEINAYLTGTNEYLSTSDDNNGYLVGVQTFSSPIVITDNTSSMNASFKVASGMTISNDDGQTPPLLGLYNGPFFVKMTTN